MTLRPGEPPLGELSGADLNWLTNALTYLIRIDESRRVENVYDNAYCVFEVGRIYFQCLALPFGTYLRYESVSENFVPELAAILTPERKGRLTREFGFTAPGYSKNFSQKIEIKGREDLAYVGRMALRVLRDVYEVKDFSVAQFKLSLPKPAPSIAEPVSPRVRLAEKPSPDKPYAVFVGDNFHYMREEEQYKSGDYTTLEEAVKKCKEIVDDFLDDKHKPGMLSDELYEQYVHFGEDPFIRGPKSNFSAWEYARRRCDELCRNPSDKSA
jgi:hypothetical protein